jgi:hypothetical protein
MFVIHFQFDFDHSSDQDQFTVCHRFSYYRARSTQLMMVTLVTMLMIQATLMPPKATLVVDKGWRQGGPPADLTRDSTLLDPRPININCVFTNHERREYEDRN